MKFTNCLKPIHRAFREARIHLFFRTMRPLACDTLLDVGGGAGLSGEFLALYAFFKRVTVLNIHPAAPECDLDTRLDVVTGDGCHMPFPSRNFDFVFSNAVIEHVGSAERQKAFAAEIRRVARKGYFVSTPNKYFPIDPHTLLPFYQLLPVGMQEVAVKISPGYLRAYEPIRLLSQREMQRLFPEATIRRTGFPIFAHNLVALWRGDDGEWGTE